MGRPKNSERAPALNCLRCEHYEECAAYENGYCPLNNPKYRNEINAIKRKEIKYGVI